MEPRPSEFRFGPAIRLRCTPALKSAPYKFLLAERITGPAITVTLSAERAGDELHVRVLDDGVGLPADWSSQSPGGLGLSITRERISGLYPDGSTHFSIHPRATGGTEVEIHFPLRLAEEIHDQRAA